MEGRLAYVGELHGERRNGNVVKSAAASAKEVVVRLRIGVKA
jgi:hypothetical protein